MNTVVITGATSGIGLAAVYELLREGYRVIAVGHSEKNCVRAEKEILLAIPDANLKYFWGDLMQQRELRRVAADISEFIEGQCGGGLHALINNAGCTRSWYATTQEGYEQQFALNHLAGFLLTHLMLPYLQKVAGRVIMTGSNSHKNTKMRWQDIMLQKRYSPLFAYKQSKLCNILFAHALNQRQAQFGVNAYVVDPGLVRTDIGFKETGGLVRFVWTLRKKQGVNPEIPAKDYAFLCNANPPEDGLYYYLCKKSRYSRQVNNENSKRLFELSQQLCSITFGTEE